MTANKNLTRIKKLEGDFKQFNFSNNKEYAKAHLQLVLSCKELRDLVVARDQELAKAKAKVKKLEIKVKEKDRRIEELESDLNFEKIYSEQLLIGARKNYLKFLPFTFPILTIIDICLI